jgi:membrane protease YdiL (CAAX protease family)
MAWLYFVALAQDEARANPGLQAAFGTGKVVQALFPLVYVWWFERGRLVPQAPTARGLGLGIGFGLLVAAATLALYHGWLKHSPLLGDAPAQVLRKVHEFNMATPAGYLTMALFICAVHSLFEEYYWRWFVFGTLKRHVSLAAALVVSGIGFTLHHIVILGVFFPDRFWILALPFSLCVGVGGGVWAWIYHRSGSLYAAWISHAIIDAAILLVGYDMVAPHLGP